jgi:hypothetical protein
MISMQATNLLRLVVSTISREIYSLTRKGHNEFAERDDTWHKIVLEQRRHHCQKSAIDVGARCSSFPAGKRRSPHLSFVSEADRPVTFS